ncbi:MAG: hypothetical protein SFU83_08350 [Meiothermus sp.]|nr:hypothetical protein [Meiothermus sp.]
MQLQKRIRRYKEDDLVTFTYRDFANREGISPATLKILRQELIPAVTKFAAQCGLSSFMHSRVEGNHKMYRLGMSISLPKNRDPLEVNSTYFAEVFGAWFGPATATPRYNEVAQAVFRIPALHPDGVQQLRDFVKDFRRIVLGENDDESSVGKAVRRAS